MKSAEFIEHILLSYEHTNALWAKCATVFRLILDMTARDDVWGRVPADWKTCDKGLLIIAVVC